jgi:hypothetical protein
VIFQERQPILRAKLDHIARLQSFLTKLFRDLFSQRFGERRVPKEIGERLRRTKVRCRLVYLFFGLNRWLRFGPGNGNLDGDLTGGNIPHDLVARVSDQFFVREDAEEEIGFAVEEEPAESLAGEFKEESSLSVSPIASEEVVDD